MTDIPITVLMSVRNGEPYVEDSVRSVLAQTYGDFRFRIVDNASTDHTLEIIRGFTDPRIELTELPSDIGQTGALNLALDQIETPYVARIDADDVSMPDRFQAQVSFLSENPDVVLLGCGYEIINEDGRSLGKQVPPKIHDDVLATMLFENPFAHSTVMVETEQVKACGGYPEFQFAQDFALWWKLGRRGRVHCLPDCLVQVRFHTGQSTHVFGPELAEEPYRVVREVLDSPGRLPESIRGLCRRAARYAEMKRGALLADVSSRFRGLLALLVEPGLLTNRGARDYAVRLCLGKTGYDWTKRFKQVLVGQSQVKRSSG